MQVARRHVNDAMPIRDPALAILIVASCDDHAIRLDADGVPIARGDRHNIPPDGYIACAFMLSSDANDCAVGSKSNGAAPPTCDSDDVAPTSNIALSVPIPAGRHYPTIRLQSDRMGIAGIRRHVNVSSCDC